MSSILNRLCYVYWVWSMTMPVRISHYTAPLKPNSLSDYSPLTEASSTKTISILFQRCAFAGTQVLTCNNCENSFLTQPFKCPVVLQASTENLFIEADLLPLTVTGTQFPYEEGPVCFWWREHFSLYIFPYYIYPTMYNVDMYLVHV